MLASLAFCRFGQDAAALLLWGAAAYLRLLVPPALALRIARDLRSGQVIATAVLLVATILRLPIEVAAIGTGFGDILDPAFVGSVLTQTSVGLAWSVQCGAAVALAAALRLPLRPGLMATCVCAGVFLVGLCLTGHAAMDAGWRGVLSRTNMAIHVLSAAAWLGALVPVLRLLRLDRSAAPGVGVALRRFSRAGHAAVGLVIATGLCSTFLVLGRLPIDFANPYDVLLDIKIAVVLVMAGLAVVNRYIVVPRLARVPRTSRLLYAGTLAEVVLGLAAVALVSAFAGLDPGG